MVRDLSMLECIAMTDFGRLPGRRARRVWTPTLWGWVIVAVTACTAPNPTYCSDGGCNAAVGAEGPEGDAAADIPGACSGNTQDLSGVGTGDFTISFNIVSSQSGWVALLNQRSDCSFGVFWDIRQTPTGTVILEIDDNATDGYQKVESAIKINDDKPHDVVVTRIAGALIITIDSTMSGQGPSLAALGSLADLRIGDDVCTSAGNDPETAKLTGTLSAVCISRN